MIHKQKVYVKNTVFKAVFEVWVKIIPRLLKTEKTTVFIKV